MKYGIYLDGLLIEKFDEPEEAYEEAMSAYDQSGMFHEVRLTSPLAEAIND